MKSKRLVTLLVLLALLFAVVVAHSAAGGVWLGYKGSFGVEGYERGLGKNESITLQLTASAYVQVMCWNNGGNSAPGRNVVFVEASTAPTSFPTTKNGRVNISQDDQFKVPTNQLANSLGGSPVSPSPKTAGCPSDNWSIYNPATGMVEIVPGSEKWTGAIIKVFEDNTLTNQIAEHELACPSGGTIDSAQCWQIR